MLENDHSYWHYQDTARKKSIVKELLPGSAACLYLVICSCAAFSYLINFFFCFIDFLRLQSDRERDICTSRCVSDCKKISLGIDTESSVRSKIPCKRRLKEYLMGSYSPK